MNELTVANNNLPSNIEDLSKFVLVGREQLVAVRAAIRAIDKVGVAQEVRKQKLKEGQEIGEAVLDAEVRIGELMRKVPKAQGKRTDVQPTDSTVGKYEVIRDAGFTPKQVERFETLAAHPEIVAQAKAEAKENDDIVTRSLVLSKIKDKQKADQRAAKMATIKEAAVTDGNLAYGDCLEELKKLADGSVDCVVTDPPYGISYVSNFRTVESEVVKSVANDTIEDAVMLWNNTCAILERKMKADSHLYCFTSWKVYPYFVNIISKYFKVKNCLIWEKNNWSMGDLDGNYAEQYEMVIFATKGNRKLNGGRDTNILHFDRVANSSLLHSCEKPVDLLSFLSWRDGEWIVAEVKNQHYYEAPPFDGHGLPPYQVASRLKFYKETGVRCLFFVHEPNTQTAYWQWLDVLDKGQQFITKGKKQRVVYPLTSFHKMEIPESILGDRK